MIKNDYVTAKLNLILLKYGFSSLTECCSCGEIIYANGYKAYVEIEFKGISPPLFDTDINLCQSCNSAIKE